LSDAPELASCKAAVEAYRAEYGVWIIGLSRYI
jgi:hypothetical protein